MKRCDGARDGISVYRAAFGQDTPPSDLNIPNANTKLGTKEMKGNLPDAHRQGQEAKGVLSGRVETLRKRIATSILGHMKVTFCPSVEET